MPDPGLSATLDRVRRAVAPEAEADGHLLARFLADRDEAAFAELVRRHGPMVLAECRRVGDRHLAEDAFQAVFLTLARKAGGMTGWASVGGWLRAVARRVAANARRQAARRREVPSNRASEQPADAGRSPENDDLGPVVLEELARLPDRFRTLLVLHYLDGHLQAELAVRLGLPAGTVNRRMMDARRALGDRLRARGVAPAAVAVALGAGVPAPLAARAVAAAMSPDSAPAAVAALSNGATRTMLIPKLKLLAAGGLAAVAVAGGLLAADRPAPAPAPAGPQPVAAVAAAPRPDDPKLKAAPPVVVKTVPTAGADDVDPATAELKVTFSKPMTDQSWTWSTTQEEYGAFPKVDAKPGFDKGLKTCSLPVKLEPGTTYAIWVNSDRFQNFKDADGNPAVPYLLTFRTKGK